MSIRWGVGQRFPSVQLDLVAEVDEPVESGGAGEGGDVGCRRIEFIMGDLRSSLRRRNHP
ncbi:hypothetical protein I6B53_02290 [Schaalia sp. 19OD2882]|uniref:hypothetical protein n=1 Tax=Schaalia sp. 19OD2882 TaxID=2794089 RepID=UPI001C1EDE47|nr:hypothetical protein [Schaalia sp. 19OD2882]QWW19963.1 hypothetical protein I6B53_02290 [Schaalia sp. 19OD2882]